MLFTQYIYIYQQMQEMVQNVQNVRNATSLPGNFSEQIGGHAHAQLLHRDLRENSLNLLM
jgi:hypothetical protein